MASNEIKSVHALSSQSITECFQSITISVFACYTNYEPETNMICEKIFHRVENSKSGYDGTTTMELTSNGIEHKNSIAKKKTDEAEIVWNFDTDHRMVVGADSGLIWWPFKIASINLVYY